MTPEDIRFIMNTHVNDGVALSHIAHHVYGISANTLRDRLKYRGVWPLEKPRIHLLRDHIAALAPGKTANQLSEITSRSSQTVRKHLSVLVEQKILSYDCNSYNERVYKKDEPT